MKRAAMALTLYDALFRMVSLRDEIRALTSQSAARDRARFLIRLDAVEAATVRLLDEAEEDRRVSSH